MFTSMSFSQGDKVCSGAGCRKENDRLPLSSPTSGETTKRAREGGREISEVKKYNRQCDSDIKELESARTRTE